jgi:hypothetical protein
MCGSLFSKKACNAFKGHSHVVTRKSGIYSAEIVTERRGRIVADSGTRLVFRRKVVEEVKRT